jgi:hypothetical protein
MDIDIFSVIGVIVPVSMIAFSVMSKFSVRQWIIAVPIIVFSFIGAVSNSGLAPLDGRWTQDRYLTGSIITILSIIGIAIVSLIKKADEK